MRSGTITIVDYQMGNLRSVQKALESVGAQAVVTSDPDEVARADKLILPGVGGFGEAIAELQKRNLTQPIVELIRSGKPMLGICLGLQMLFEVGYENGTHQGLGVFQGDVVRFSGEGYSVGSGLKVPHMGWNQVAIKKLGCPLFNDIPERSYFYFVHSYFVRPKDPNIVWLECDYGQSFCAAVWKDNVYATQFHPEKSQAIGLKLLSNFAQM
jgi:imidazole glycerol-phosphate synthase subunit HisH